MALAALVLSRPGSSNLSDRASTDCCTDPNATTAMRIHAAAIQRRCPRIHLVNDLNFVLSLCGAVPPKRRGYFRPLWTETPIRGTPVISLTRRDYDL